jgi:hypothetical protein
MSRENYIWNPVFKLTAQAIRSYGGQESSERAYLADPERRGELTSA